MSGHTPGPWIRESGVLVSTGYRTNIKTTDGTITKLQICRTDNVYMGEQEQGANARLIAAAPELLEACKAGLDCIEKFGKDFTTADFLRHTIARAEGK